MSVRGEVSAGAPNQRPSFTRAFFDNAVQGADDDIAVAIAQIELPEDAYLFTKGFEESLREDGVDPHVIATRTHLEIYEHIKSGCNEGPLRIQRQKMWTDVFDDMKTIESMGGSDRIRRIAGLIHDADSRFLDLMTDPDFPA